MRFLFVHNCFPGQFRRLAPYFASLGHDVRFLSRRSEWHSPDLNNIHSYNYSLHRPNSGHWQHPYLRRFESFVIEGQGVYRKCIEFKTTGWLPDIVISHAGFGNGLYLRDVFPDSRHVTLFEWYYNSIGSDVDFLDRGTPVNQSDEGPRVRTLNASILLELAACDLAVVPTHWQKSQFPLRFQHLFTVIHEGIDASRLNTLRCSTCPDLDFLPNDALLLTYVSRGFEPYRGFPQVMEAIVILQSIFPNLHAAILGSDVVAYGGSRDDGRTWGEWAKSDLSLDPLRTHWLGSTDSALYELVLSRSDLHLYFTVPFILSWSFLEAMAIGCAIVASDTSPVTEVASHDKEALLVDFFDVEAIVSSSVAILTDQALSSRLRLNSIVRSAFYDFSVGSKHWEEAIGLDAVRGV